MEETPAMDLIGLDLDDKARLLGGATTWRTHEVQAAGVPTVKMSDGPNGVRGEFQDGGLVPGVVVPVGIALGATWNPTLLGRIGDLLGREAIRKRVHVLLGPTVNLHRTPVGGRVFECYSEDPELTARLAVAYVRGVQSHDVAVTVKHFVGNDTEIERNTVDVRIPEGALRELYLRPFEAAVVEAGAWGIMSAYNQIDGEFCAHNHRLLTEILRDEWGFDGFVVSDWDGAHDTAGAIHAGLTVAMPGPRTIYGRPLADAVRDGSADETDVDRQVHDLLRLIERTHAADRPADGHQESVDEPAERELCHQAAVESITLLANPVGALPLRPDARVALIGPNAARTRIMGGGSSSLRPMSAPSILDALRSQLGDRLVGHAQGASIEKLLLPVTADRLRRADGRPGLDVNYYATPDASGPVVGTSVTDSGRLLLMGSVPDACGPGQFAVSLTGTFVASVSGPHRFGASITGKGQVTVGDTVVLADPERTLPRGDWMFGFATEERTAVVDLEAGEAVDVEIRSSGVKGMGALTLGVEEPREVALIDEALVLAADADVAVVVVGTTDEWETEGVDRTTLGLPGDQDELVRRVAAVAPSTVVVVNCGGPVGVPWVEEVDAVVWASFAGQETGPAVAAVLEGAADPGGRLPVTWPVRLEDCPAWPYYRPVDGVQTYGEGRLMGYRGHDAAGVAPRFPFGHGGSYGTSTWRQPSLAAERVAVGDEIVVRVPIEATGVRAATDVVQVYLEDEEVGAPPKVLVGFAKAVTEPGEVNEVDVVVPASALRRWDDASNRWITGTGVRRLAIAASAADVRHTVEVTIESVP
ncbi:MAG: glycoside hydrolase family 3 protein [Acidimicrobiales bacterium]|nr:glycoside hydrolase family 3 protein [Acidimicrobiales bacterium]